MSKAWKKNALQQYKTDFFPEIFPKTSKFSRLAKLQVSSFPGTKRWLCIHPSSHPPRRHKSLRCWFAHNQHQFNQWRISHWNVFQKRKGFLWSRFAVADLPISETRRFRNILRPRRGELRTSYTRQGANKFETPDRYRRLTREEICTTM